MSQHSTALHTLKSALQRQLDPSAFEKLAAALLSHLLDVPIAVAKSGFQYGADAGAVGKRRLRLECKQYRDGSRLNERELLGQIDQALARDPALEAWILVTTRAVPEQLRQTLDRHGEQQGVPTAVIDWADYGVPPLAALCVAHPDCVQTLLSTEAAAAARALQPVSDPAVNSLRHNLEGWCLGFPSLQQQSHARLHNIWHTPTEATSVLGQDAAGGSRRKRVERKSICTALGDWSRGPADDGAPVALIGLEGTGKTWAALDWLARTDSEQPVVLIVPSSAAQTSISISETNLKRFLADRLHDLTGVRDPTHWFCRLDRLLERPRGEGPVLTIFFDGLNQEPSVSWLGLLKTLQGEAFAGRLRVIVSSRKDHFENRLSSLNGLIVPATRIVVDRYDDTPGGELDQMLEYESLSRSEFHPDVLEMARTPRLFDLVVRFKDSLVDSGQVTVHRLLWEYGRDTFGVRAGRSFSEQEWRDWLKTIAEQRRAGIYRFSLRGLGETVTRPDLSDNAVYARLSDLIDGRFATPSASGDLQLTPAVVFHALAVALLNHIDQVNSPTVETLNVRLKEWLDPIAGFDQPAEILRAAISILVEQGRAGSAAIPGVLVTEWLQAQNVPDTHRREIVSLAPNFPEALLDAIEHSASPVHDSARSCAVAALREIPRTDASVFSIIVARASSWLKTIFRDIDTRRNADTASNAWRSKRLRERIGTDSVGSISVAGLKVELADQSLDRIKTAVPSVMEGFPLAGALPVFEAAAVELAITDRNPCWDRLKWICLFNEVDPEETARGLRDLSEQVRGRDPGPDVHPDLPKRIAALLLRLTGGDSDERAAASLNTDFGQTTTYEQAYLAQPSRSLFALERRHAALTLNDTDLSLEFRVGRMGNLWLDPTFLPPDTFVEELRTVAARIDVEKLSRHGGTTIDDQRFDQLEPALARCAPELLADLIRRKIRSFSTCPPESRYWVASRSAAHFLLAGNAEIAALRTLRLTGASDDMANDCFAANEILLTEICDLNARDQFETLIQADLDTYFSRLSDVLRPLTKDNVDVLVGSYASSSPKERRDLLALLSARPLDLTDFSWSSIDRFRKPHEHRGLRHLVFKILAQADVVRFGHTLIDDNWHWKADAHEWVNHYGTAALIEVSSSVSFDELAPRLAPWGLLEAVQRRGEDPVEVRLAAELLSQTLMDDNLDELDPGSTLSVDLMTVRSSPFSYSIEPRRSANDIENMQLAMDAEARRAIYQRSIDTAVSRIAEARRTGASLWHAILDVSDFELVLRHVPDIVDRWLQGVSGTSADFRRRVRLAEGAYLALCEALLIHDPDRGSQLWRVLSATVATRYLGEAGVDELVHMVFRVPHSAAVAKLREEIIELPYCDTDTELFELTVAATHSREVDWLKTIMGEDRASRHLWRQQRAMVVDGFLGGKTLPVQEAWPDGKLETTRAWVSCVSARSQSIKACASHWWRLYCDASDPVEAYAAWILFLRSADRRAWVLARPDINAPSSPDDFLGRKMIHCRLNENNLQHAMRKRDEQFDQTFLHRKIERGIGPWT